MKHRFSDAARADFRDAVSLYDDAAGLGGAFAAEVMRYAAIIEANPQGFSSAARSPKGREIRVVKIGRFDYLLYHEVLDTEVVILAILHARRKTSEWRKRTP